jgi:hypothetical protein
MKNGKGRIETWQLRKRQRRKQRRNNWLLQPKQKTKGDAQASPEFLAGHRSALFSTTTFLSHLRRAARRASRPRGSTDLSCLESRITAHLCHVERRRVRIADEEESKHLEIAQVFDTASGSSHHAVSPL